MGIYGCDGFDAGRIEDSDKAREDGVIELFFVVVQFRWKLVGWDDGVVIRYFFVIDDAVGDFEVLEVKLVNCFRAVRAELFEQRRYGRFEVGGEVSTVGSGVGYVLGFV